MISQISIKEMLQLKILINHTVECVCVYFAVHTIQSNNFNINSQGMMESGLAYVLLWNKFGSQLDKEKMVGSATPPLLNLCPKKWSLSPDPRPLPPGCLFAPV